MKIRILFMWLTAIFLCGNCLAMEHVKRDEINTLELQKIVIDNSTKPNTCRLMFEVYADNVIYKQKGNSPRPSPRSDMQKLGPQLDKYIAGLQQTDPELYKRIMDYKTSAEANSKSAEEIRAYIQQNLDQLDSIDVFQHLYNVQAEALEAQKKKDYELHELLKKEDPADLLTLYHALLYRSASIPDKTVAQQEAEKSKDCLEKWLNKIAKTDPAAYALLMQAHQQIQQNNLNQHDAIPVLLDVVDQISNLEPLQNLMKEVQNKYQLNENTRSIWQKAAGIIGCVVTILGTIAGSTGGVLGGLLGADKATIANATVVVANCTLARCLALMNVTIG